MKTTISITIPQSDLKEYMVAGFFTEKLDDLDITLMNVYAGRYSDEFEILLQGMAEDLLEFLKFYGFSDEEIDDQYELVD